MDLSVVIPVYNEEAGLPALFARLYPALDALGLRYEVIFVNDGSRDRSAAILREQFAGRPDVTRVVLLNGNFGQHLAIMAGFERCRGERVVTLDADLQNPPEEIKKLLARMDEGYDYVGGVRRMRQDPWLRRALSKLMKVGLEHDDAPVLLKFSEGEFRRLLARFRDVRVVPERFPVKSRLHGGWKGTVYNGLFVGTFNALPRALVRRFGWHLLAFCSK